VKVVGALGVNISVGESRELILLIGESNRIVLVTYSVFVFVCDKICVGRVQVIGIVLPAILFCAVCPPTSRLLSPDIPPTFHSCRPSA
jgi:hypothetical protein